MSLIKELKKNRANFMEKLRNEVIKTQNYSSSRNEDDRFWQPTKDKAGNSVSVIRFLPNTSAEDLPWVRTYSHGFQNKNNGSWYIESCPTTINQKCPLCEANNVLWNTGLEKNQNIVRERKRRLHYISNVLIVTDPAHPENDGQVKLFKYGKKIFDKINSAMFPEFEDMKAINPFDAWEGANFKLRVRKYEGYTNYDKSEFVNASSISDDDDELESILLKVHSLVEFVDAKSFKNYDELKTRLNKVLAENIVPASHEDDDIVDEDDDIEEERVEAAPRVTTKQESAKPEVREGADDADDEIESYLKSLANDTD